MPAPDALPAAVEREPLAARLPEHLRAGLRIMASIDSTQDALLADAARTPDRSIVLSTHQRSGRGRRGRNWTNPPGAGLALSMLARQPSGGRWAPSLTLALGVAAAEALHALGLVQVGLKWPNDLVAGGRKLGGILVETCAPGVVAGIGLNLALSGAQRHAIDQPCTDLSELACDASVETVAVALIMAWDRAFSEFAGVGLAGFQARWAQLDALAGQPVRAIADGMDDVHGLAQGIDAHGRLRIDAQGRRLALVSAEVSVRAA